jgi:hypothetical protein
MADQSKTFAEMRGEALREIAVPVIVFAPLDRWVEHRNYTWIDFWETFASALRSLFPVLFLRKSGRCRVRLAIRLVKERARNGTTPG